MADTWGSSNVRSGADDKDRADRQREQQEREQRKKKLAAQKAAQAKAAQAKTAQAKTNGGSLQFLDEFKKSPEYQNAYKNLPDIQTADFIDNPFTGEILVQHLLVILEVHTKNF